MKIKLIHIINSPSHCCSYHKQHCPSHLVLKASTFCQHTWILFSDIYI